MKDIFWIVKNSFKVTFNKKSKYITYFIFPLLGVFLGLASYGTNHDNSLNIGVVDKDNSYISSDVVNYIKSIGSFKVQDIDENKVKDKVASEDVDCVIIFNKGFGDDLINQKPQNIEIASLKGETSTAFVKLYLNDYVDNIARISKISNNERDFKSLYNQFKNEGMKVNISKVEDKSKNRDITASSIGFLLMVSLMGAGNLTEIILKERKDRTFLRILSSSIGPKKYLVANFTINTLVLFMQNILILGLLKVLNINTNVPFIAMLGMLTVFSLVAVGACLVIISFCKNSNSVSSLQTLIFVLTCQVSGCFFDVSFMPDSMQRIAKFLPQRWLLDAVERLQNGQSVYMNVLILLAFSVVFFLTAIYGFKKINDVRDFI